MQRTESGKKFPKQFLRPRSRDETNLNTAAKYFAEWWWPIATNLKKKEKNKTGETMPCEIMESMSVLQNRIEIMS